MLHISFLINDFSSALLSRLPLDGFSRGFHRSVPLWLQMNDLNLDFRIFKGRCHGNQLSFSEISFFFAVTPKRREVDTWSREKKM